MRTLKHTGRLFGAAAILAVLAGTAFAATATQKSDPAKEYEACATLAKTHPQDAFAAATFWAGKGGGLLAVHCKGLAQMALGQFGGAAKSFAALAESKRTKLSDATRARLFAQAAQASLHARQAENASAFLARSVSLQPDVAGFRIDRSITLALAENYEAAITELNAVLAKDAGHVEALTFRASAYRTLNRTLEAEADIAQALLIQPDKPEALLERGAIYAVAGNLDGARQDWEQVIRIVPDSTAAKAAQDNLNKLHAVRPSAGE
jgi:tetratricopeptide (TPR) repeat protein